jgi:hypothetical protein
MAGRHVSREASPLEGMGNPSLTIVQQERLVREHQV